MMNSKPLFRYNNYFGIAQVHYLDLVDITDKETLDMGTIIRGALLTRIMQGGARGHANGAMNRISRGLASGLATLKFIAAEDEDGFCRIAPIVQATACTDGRIVFTGKPYADELGRIAPGQKVAVFAMNMALESVLTQGIYRGIQRGLGVMDVEMVYNPLLPVSGYILPQSAAAGGDRVYLTDGTAALYWTVGLILGPDNPMRAAFLCHGMTKGFDE